VIPIQVPYLILVDKNAIKVYLETVRNTPYVCDEPRLHRTGSRPTILIFLVALAIETDLTGSTVIFFPITAIFRIHVLLGNLILYLKLSVLFRFWSRRKSRRKVPGRAMYQFPQLLDVILDAPDDSIQISFLYLSGKNPIPLMKTTCPFSFLFDQSLK
jgi:hypothetical protein